MKRILLGCAAVIFTTAAASATDLPARAPAAIYKAAPAYSWSGLYGGISGGYAFGENKITDDVTGFAGDKFKPSGGFGGLQLGYREQFDPHWMLGGQVDLSAGDVSDKLTVGGASGKNSFNYFGTARTTFGYVQDRTMIYATGGAIWLRDKFTATGTGTTDSSQYHVGWVWGGGIEYAFDPRWSVNLEYLYAPLDRSHDVSSGAVATRRTDADFSIIRAGLNYRFSDGDAGASYMPTKAAAPRSDWNGSYFGVHGGYGWSTLDKDDSSGAVVTAHLNPEGGYGGFGGGYNWVYAPNSLIGIETDSSFGDLKQTRTGGGITATNKVEDLGTARLRLGYLATQSMLVYVTGGAAYAREKSTDSTGGDTKVDHLGWTAGVGTEYMFAPQWSLKAEWLYADLGKFKDSGTSLGSFTKQSDMTLGTARIGINYYGPIIERLFGAK